MSKKNIGGQKDTVGDPRGYRGTHQNLELNVYA